MRRLASIAIATVVLALGRPHGVAGQSVAEVVQGMYAAAEKEAEGVNDYALTQLVMGTETFNYYEKEIIDGHPVFLSKMAGGTDFSLSLAGDDYGVGDVFIYGPRLIEHGRYAGMEQIGNFSVHVLAVDDASALGLVPPTGADPNEFSAKSLALYVDATLMVPRRIVLVGEVATAAGPAEMTIQIDLQNLLPIESFWVPFKTTVTVAGAKVDLTVGEVLLNAGRPEA
jgi:hypothetical protein